MRMKTIDTIFEVVDACAKLGKAIENNHTPLTGAMQRICYDLAYIAGEDNEELRSFPMPSKEHIWVLKDVADCISELADEIENAKEDF